MAELSILTSSMSIAIQNILYQYKEMKKLFLLLPFLVIACIMGPKSERKSKLNYLNDEHYNASPATGSNSVLSIPIARRKEKTSEVSGSILYKEKSLMTPLNRQKIILTDAKGNRIAETLSKADGSFNFSQVLTNGFYRISVKSKKYSGTIKITINSYNTKNLKLFVTSMKNEI